MWAVRFSFVLLLFLLVGLVLFQFLFHVVFIFSSHFHMIYNNKQPVTMRIVEWTKQTFWLASNVNVKWAHQNINSFKYNQGERKNDWVDFVRMIYFSAVVWGSLTMFTFRHERNVFVVDGHTKLRRSQMTPGSIVVIQV